MSKSLEDETAIKELDLGHLFLQSRKAVGRQIINQFHIAKKVDQRPDLSLHAFLRSFGVPDDELSTFDGFTSVLDEKLADIKEELISFDLIKALITVNEDIRSRAINKLMAGAPISISDIHQLSDWAAWFQASDEDEFLSDGEAALDRAVERVATGLKSVIRQKANELLKALILFNSTNSESSDVDNRSEVVQLASDLLIQFRSLFGTEFVGIEDWHLIALDNPENRELAQCNYALDRISKGDLGQNFLVLENGYYAWSALDSISYLAGVKLDKRDQRARFRPRPMRKLNALVLCANGGGQALGIEAAGFRISVLHENSAKVSVTSANKNRPDWNTIVSDLRDKDSRDRIVSAAKASGSLDLIAGALPTAMWKTGKDGFNDADDLLGHVTELLKSLAPRSFFLETHKDIHTKSHRSAKHKLLTDYAKLGYQAEIVDLDVSHFGVPQQGRVHTYIIGMRKSDWANYRSPVLASRVTRNLRDALGDIAFPNRSMSERSSDADARKAGWESRLYDIWAENWLNEKGDDLAADVRHYDSDHFDDWAKLRINTRLQEDVAPTNKEAFLHLTIPMLQRLQSLPDDWLLTSGSDEGKLAELKSMTPPRLALAIARSIHIALTDQEVDPAFEGAVTIRSGKRRWDYLRDYNDFKDPLQHAAMEWKLFIQDEFRARDVDIEPSDLLDDDNDEDAFDASEMDDQLKSSEAHWRSKCRMPIR